MAEHTPGPWDLSFDDEYGGHRIRMGIAIENKAAYQPQHLLEWPHGLGSDWGSNEQYEEAEANARLMAASPDLLSACRLALDLLGSKQINDTNKDDPETLVGLGVVLELTAAIAKATGEPS